eukprot:6108133-Amphidinium_carterae.1
MTKVLSSNMLRQARERLSMLRFDSQLSDGVDAGCAQVSMVEAFAPDYDPSHMSEPVDGGDENEDEVDDESD